MDLHHWTGEAYTALREKIDGGIYIHPFVLDDIIADAKREQICHCHRCTETRQRWERSETIQKIFRESSSNTLPERKMRI